MIKWLKGYSISSMYDKVIAWQSWGVNMWTPCIYTFEIDCNGSLRVEEPDQISSPQEGHARLFSVSERLSSQSMRAPQPILAASPPFPCFIFCVPLAFATRRTASSESPSRPPPRAPAPVIATCSTPKTLFRQKKKRMGAEAERRMMITVGARNQPSLTYRTTAERSNLQGVQKVV